MSGAGPAPLHPRRPPRPGGAGRGARRDDLIGGRPVRPARRTDRRPADAEVAFVVGDAQQGRGIGSVLLEHLAAAARERGIKRFVAEVLAENSRMVRVFTDAGYAAEYQYDSGVVQLTLPDRADRDSPGRSRPSGSAAPRPARSSGCSRPGSVAVIGASTDPKKIGHVVFANLMAYGFAGAGVPGASGGAARRRRAGVPDRAGRAGRRRPRGRRGPGGRRSPRSSSSAAARACAGWS